MFTSKPRKGTGYKELPEMTAGGLHAAAFELFRKYVSPGAKVLDLGSGAGAWAKRPYDASYSVTACDLELRTDLLEFPCHVVDLNQNFGAMLGNAEFDAISIVELIEHLENPQARISTDQILTEKRRVCTPYNA